MSMRDWTRESLYRLLYLAGGEGSGVRVNLLYHSIGTASTHSVPELLFERQMKLLAERFEIVRLCDWPKVISEDRTAANIACVTFDDGYRDNYEVALPVLERIGFKATFFITTGLLGKTFHAASAEYPMMSEAHVRPLAALGHEVAAHTITHPKLTRVALERATAEVQGSKCFLEDLLGSGIVSFAYPKGDYNETVKALVRESGFSFAVTVRQGMVDGHLDWLALPRVWISSQINTKGFAARMSPATERYQRIRQRLRLG